jgi:lipopolysaccharide transport system permease protein
MTQDPDTRPASADFFASDFRHWSGFVLEAVKREHAGRYAGVSLALLWRLALPLAQILIFTLIFAELFRARIPGNSDPMAYGIYICAGLLPWQFFAEISSRGVGMFVEHGVYLKKSALPRLVVPLIVILSATINFLITVGLFLLFLAFVGRLPALNVLPAFLGLVLLLSLFAGALALWLGTLNVFLRDVGQFFAVMLQFWFWLTPIVWPIHIVPESLREILAWNPLAGIFGGMQTLVLQGEMPSPHHLYPAIAVTLALMLLAAITFHRYAKEITDEL